MANSIRNKNKLYKSFCKEKDPKTKEYYEKQFKSYRNHISLLLRETKDSYNKQYFDDIKKNLTLVWQTVKGIINMKKKSDVSISSLLIDGQIITSAKEISNYFNNFFTRVAKKIKILSSHGVRRASYQWFKSYLTRRQQYTTIAHLKSDLRSINYGVPQGTVLDQYYFYFILMT